MASEVSICNLGLTKIGEEQILSLTEDSKAGRLCNLHYPHLRDTVLRSHLWNFAIKRVALAVNTTAPVYDFDNAFALPSDLIRILDTNLLNESEWKIENNNLIADDSAVSIRYVARITDTNEFDILFVEALACRIAAELAQPLADNLTLVDAMFQLYEKKLRDARSADSQEGTPDNITADAWLDARLGYISPYNA
tara:strand:+ start:7435 stop:8019 length:585 start_codon:yes stop_codon:yes gene_type:complete